MSKGLPPPHPVALRRALVGWSQALLAERAGIPRTTLSAIEGRRLTPSVTAALGVARALGVPVEALFGEGRPRQEWALEPCGEAVRYWEARVGDRHLFYPVASLATNAFPHDGVWRMDCGMPARSALADETLMLAGCDPAAGLLAAELARTAGVRLLVLECGGMAALDLLRRGLVHVAGLHFSTKENPGRNREVAVRELGSGFHLLRAASWEEGIALPAPDRRSKTASLLRRTGMWALREPGSAARDCLDGLLEGRVLPKGRAVAGHAAVAGSVRDGWAVAGVCARVSAEEAGLGFRPVREEFLDYCVADANLGDSRVKALLRVLRSREHRRLLDELPGYGSADTGAILSL